jgi:small nuclear ribonucleoprotein (snRNP)-like protein
MNTTTNRQTPTDSTNTHEPRNVVAALFGKEICCTMDDGRTVCGKFICLDRLKNMILNDVVEVRLLAPHLQRPHVLEGVPEAGDSRPSEERYRCERRLAHAMVPGKHLIKVEVKKSIWEKL